MDQEQLLLRFVSKVMLNISFILPVFLKEDLLFDFMQLIVKFVFDFYYILFFWFARFSPQGDMLWISQI